MKGKTLMAGIDRRNFLTRGSMVVAAAGVATAVPGLATDLMAAESDVPTFEADAGALEESLVVHVRDLSSGEIGVFSGTREIVVHDTDLAGRLFRTTR
jgi:hypothetical protein